jgi:hypothetical protein
MARFPARESEVIALAHQMAAGFAGHSDLFANPPLSADHLQRLLTAFLADRDAANLADSRAAEAHAKKDASLDQLKDGMTTLLRYAENIASPDQFGLIGWSGRSAAAALEAPGQPRALEAMRQGAGWVFLDWKEPAEGGKPAAYHLQRRELPDGAWQPAGLAVISEATVTGQPTGKRLEYRVLAVNKAGEGMASNGVEVVL